MTRIKGYTCNCCGEYHEELPTSYGIPAPVYYYDVALEELNNRFELDDDLCIMDNEHFFIRGCIEIPIISTTEYLIWGVWVSISEANFNKTNVHWDKQELLEPMLGWLSTALPCYPDTVNLKAMVHFRPNGMRPYIELEPTNHPLAVEYRNGVTIERV
ncbi:DUF2199 domain-containing protein [Bacillus sp. Cr_A10]|uniref:DUF2199 domain-containing protein n=1 Tax=Bacillus sp. Cr_A10 TaxID=3033993 RepID=UPI0023DB95DF|nr:DUF2199 domain-containing protein [Bacillus sp. Cr_A10]MDF2066643.1 DUF2199 domain-containing protein [Bacillus sp. Cr_A10]